MVKELDGDVLLDDIGIRHCTRSAAHALIAKRNAAQAKTRELNRQKAAAFKRQKAARKAAHAAQLAARRLLPDTGGVPPEPDWTAEQRLTARAQNAMENQR